VRVLLRLADETAGRKVHNRIYLFFTHKESSLLRSRLGNKNQLERLRNLSNILIERTAPKTENYKFLELISDETKEREFYRAINK